MTHRPDHLQNLDRQHLYRQQKAADNRHSVPTVDDRCHNCGAPLSSGTSFCEECGATVNPDNTSTCPICNARITVGLAICPACGHNLSAGQCSFCGATLNVDDRFCPECGNPREGLRCPRCGAHNQRNFCRRCAMPLNETAHKMIERIKDDPRIAHAHQLALELAQLEDILADAGAIDVNTADTGSNIGLNDSPSCLDDHELICLDEYNNLMELSSITPHSDTNQTPDTGRSAERLKFSVKNISVADAINTYRSKAKEMQDTLDKIVPDAGMNAEEQRNFFTACHIVVMTDVVSHRKVKDGWICNWCGCHHSTPSECCRPELGGKWIYREIEIKSKAAGTGSITI